MIKVYVTFEFYQNLCMKRDLNAPPPIWYSIYHFYFNSPNYIMEKFHYLSDMLLYSLLLLLDILRFMSRTSIKILSKAFIHFYHSVCKNLNLHAKIISFFFIKVADNSMFLNTACTVLKEHVDIRYASLKNSNPGDHQWSVKVPLFNA